MRLARCYVRHQSLILDLAIISQTILCLLKVPLVVCDMSDMHIPLRSGSPNTRSKVVTIILKWRRPLIVSLDIGLIILANYLAFWLRFDGNIPAMEWGLFVQLLPWLVVVRGVVFFAFRLNEGLWRYTSLWDLQNIVTGVMTSTLLFYGLAHWAMGVTEYPRSIFVIDAILLIGFTTGCDSPEG